MGWKFTATSKKLAPRKFWGITKASIMMGRADADADERDVDEDRYQRRLTLREALDLLM